MTPASKIFLAVMIFALMGIVAFVASAGRAPEAVANNAAAAARSNIDAEDSRLRSDAKEAVRANLRDPGSAEFRDVVVVRKPGSIAVCGEVNARNGFGGYTGFTQFMARDAKAALRSGPSDAAFVTRWNRACASS